MTVEMRLLRRALEQRVRDLRLNFVVVAIAAFALICSLVLTLFQYRLADHEATLRNQRAVCVNTINANWQSEFGALIADGSPQSRTAEGKPPLTPEEQRVMIADFRHATALSHRVPEICYGPGAPDETPLDR